MAPILCLLAVCSFAFTQQGTLSRNTNFRSKPIIRSNTVIKTLTKGAAVDLVSKRKRSGFYHVIVDGQQGWVTARNVRITAGGSVNATPSSASTPPTHVPGLANLDSTECDSVLWTHVYHAPRLIKKKDCVAVTGTIVDATHGKRADGVRKEADGDTHGWIKLDPEFSGLLNAGNTSDEGGNLVFEIVCKFPVKQADAVASCAHFTNSVTLPPVGSHVRVVGSYVQDTNHAQWMEIHPVTSITVIQ